MTTNPKSSLKTPPDEERSTHSAVQIYQLLARRAPTERELQRLANIQKEFLVPLFVTLYREWISRNYGPHNFAGLFSWYQRVERRVRIDQQVDVHGGTSSQLASELLDCYTFVNLLEEMEHGKP